MRRTIKRLTHDSGGASAIEYGLLIGIIAVSLIVGFEGIGNQMIMTWQIVAGYTANSQPH